VLQGREGRQQEVTRQETTVALNRDTTDPSQP
jgi:hypothetical protein